MTAAVIVAVIALAGTLGNIVLTYLLNVRSEQRIKRRKADAAWMKHLDAHRFASEQLSSRLDNILNDSFLNEYGPATNTTRKRCCRRSSGSRLTLAGLKSYGER